MTSETHDIQSQIDKILNDIEGLQGDFFHSNPQKKDLQESALKQEDAPDTSNSSFQSESLVPDRVQVESETKNQNEIESLESTNFEPILSIVPGEILPFRKEEEKIEKNINEKSLYSISEDAEFNAQFKIGSEELSVNVFDGILSLKSKNGVELKLELQAFLRDNKRKTA